MFAMLFFQHKSASEQKRKKRKWREKRKTFVLLRATFDEPKRASGSQNTAIMWPMFLMFRFHILIIVYTLYGQEKVKKFTVAPRKLLQLVFVRTAQVLGFFGDGAQMCDDDCHRMAWYSHHMLLT